MSDWLVAPDWGWKGGGWKEEGRLGALRKPISLEALLQARDLSNFRGPRRGSEELGQVTWGGRHQTSLRKGFGVWKKVGLRDLSPLAVKS